MGSNEVLEKQRNDEKEENSSPYSIWKILNKSFSIIIPIYSEEKKIVKTLTELGCYIKRHALKAEIIVVNYSNNERIVTEVTKAKESIKNVLLISCEKNIGEGEAVLAGVEIAKGDFILFLDADMPTPINQMEKLVPALISGHDIAIGSRLMQGSTINKYQSIAQSMQQSILHVIVGLFYIKDYKYTQCGFSLFTNESAKTIFQHQKSKGFFFDIEILYIARQCGFKIKEVLVDFSNYQELRNNPLIYTIPFLFELIALKKRFKTIRENTALVKKNNYRVQLAYDFFKEIGGLERVISFQANKLLEEFKVELLFDYIDHENLNFLVSQLSLQAFMDPAGTRKIKETLKNTLIKKNEVLALLSSLLGHGHKQKYDGDLILAHSFMTCLNAYRANKKFAVMIHHPPNFLYATPSGWANNAPRFCAWLLGRLLGGILRTLDKKAVRSAKIVIVNSKTTARRIESIYGVKPEIMYPPYSDFFKVLEQKNKPLTPYLLAHGRIIPDKNFVLLLDIIDNFPGYELIISGNISADYLQILKNRAKGKKVRFLPNVSNEKLLSLYNSASAFLMPAKKEDFGITTVEAMACGCPVVSWNDDAGPSEIIDEGINGYLASPYVMEDFVRKIHKVLERTWDRKQVSDSVKRFREQSIGMQFLKSIKNVIHEIR